jgi:hypothetical protein
MRGHRSKKNYFYFARNSASPKEGGGKSIKKFWPRARKRHFWHPTWSQSYRRPFSKWSDRANLAIT